MDKLLEILNGSAPMPRRVIEGEHLSMTVRMVISPSAGIYQPVPSATSGTAVDVGGLLGHVGESEVRSAFSGNISGMLALAGERVTIGQPIAWLDAG